MTVTIRTATLADLPDMVRLLSEDDFCNGREDYRLPLPDCYTEAFKNVAASPDVILLVAESELGVVGCLQVTFTPGISQRGATRATLEAVMVDRRCQSRGIGAQLVQTAIAEARSRHCRFVQLTSNKGRAHAHRFYEKLGFQKSHEGMKLAL